MATRPTATTRSLSADEVVRNVQSKLTKAGLDCTKYARQLKDIASLFEPERSRVELIAEGHRAGTWDMFCYFKGIRHCFHSAREVAATFGIPIVKAEPAKRKREEPPAPTRAEPRSSTVAPMALDERGELINKLTKASAEPNKKSKAERHKDKKGRMGSRFANQKLVKAINANVGMEVSCGNLKARLVSTNLGGMTFELLDEAGRPSGDMVPPSQLAKRSCLAHQNNAWKSIKVEGVTLDTWVGRLQDEVEVEDRAAGIHVPMPRDRGADDEDDTATADDEDNDEDDNSGEGSEQQQPSYSGGGASKGLDLLSGAALQRMRYPDVARAQQADNGEGPWGRPGRQEDAASRPGVGGGAEVKGGFSTAEALIQLQQQSRAAAGEDPSSSMALHQQLHQAHDTILSLNEENKQLRSRRDRLERLVAQKNQEIAESMKSVVEVRNEASQGAQAVDKARAQLEEQLAAEHSARLDAEARLAELMRIQSGEQVLKLSLCVVDPAGGNSNAAPAQASRVVKLEELLAKTVQTMNYLLHEVEKSGVAT